MNDDGDLLRQFAETQDEACFATLVQRHLGFVYAISLRRLRDPHAAKDAAQAVFVALARKAGAVARGPSVVGWLHRSACYETMNLMRAQANRLARETEAQRLGTTAAEPRPEPGAIDAVLDEVLLELPGGDREAILARYFSGQSYAEIGATLRLSENSARMRVERALARLRKHLVGRGVTSTAVVLAEALPAYASASVPSGLAAAVTQASLVGVAGGIGAAGGLGVAGSISAAGGFGAATATIITFMSTTKIVVGVALVAALGGTYYGFHRNAALEAELAEARTASASAVPEKQLQALQREKAALKQPVATAARTNSGSAAPAATAKRAGGAAAPATPAPGVTPKVSKGWFKYGGSSNLYEVGTDENNAWGGMPSAYAKSTGEAAESKLGGMMQTIAADTYQNQRVRLSGWMKTQDANDSGGHLWMRVDGQQPNQMLGLDNMDGRAPKGTTDWQEYSLVLDVPANASKLNYGFYVKGKGQVWVNGVTITPVGTDVPTTNMIKEKPPLPAQPENLGFAPPKS